MKYRNLADLFWTRASRRPAKTLLRYKTRLNKPLEDISWAEAQNQITEIAHGLKALGIEKGDNVCLLSATCHYWFLCDLGIISMGARTVPIYHSSTTSTVQYIVNHSDAELVFVRNKIQLQKLRACWDCMPKLKYAVVILDKGDLPENDPRIITLDELRNVGKGDIKKEPDFIEKRIKEIKADDPASIIYTSGTTGDPKGVVLSHRNILISALTFYEYVPLNEGERILSFLPLAHVFERVAGQFYGIDQAAIFTYCEKTEYLPKLLIESDCTVMMVVPRILEKMYDKVMANINSQSFLKRIALKKAIDTGIKYHKMKVKKEKIPKSLEAGYELLQKTLLGAIKKKIAPKIKYFVVGGAPMPEKLIYFFMALDINVLQGYGLTESTAAITVNPPWANKPGTVGLPFNHFEVKIAEDGEILAKGPAIFKEYFKNPEATAEALLDGWLYTGDIGILDDEGYLKITDRKKDLIINAAGKNISPSRVENMIKASNFINQVVVLGDREKYLAAMVSLNVPEIKEYMEKNSISLNPGQSYSDSPEINKLIREEIDEHSNDLASYEKIKAFHILDRELSIDAGEITPTLKVRRNVIRAKYQDIIQPLFKREKPVSKFS